MIKYCCSEMDELSEMAIHEGKKEGMFLLSIYAFCGWCSQHAEKRIKIIYCPFCGKRIEAEKKR